MILRALQSGMFIAVSNVSSSHVCLAMISLQLVQVDDNWNLFAKLSESRTLIGPAHIRHMAQCPNSDACTKNVLDFWATASVVDPVLVAIRVGRIRAVARHGGDAYRVPLKVFFKRHLTRNRFPVIGVLVSFVQRFGSDRVQSSVLARNIANFFGFTRVFLRVNRFVKPLQKI